MFAKVDATGQVMEDHIVIKVRDRDVGVRNITRPVFLEATVENLTWVITELQADLARDGEGGPQVAGDQDGEAVGENAEAEASDPEEQHHSQCVFTLIHAKYTGLKGRPYCGCYATLVCKLLIATISCGLLFYFASRFASTCGFCKPPPRITVFHCHSRDSKELSNTNTRVTPC